jgi:hypothetical protein
MNLKGIFLASIFLVMVFSLTASFAFAHPHSGQILINGHTHEPQTEIIPLNSMMGLEKNNCLLPFSSIKHIAMGIC